MKKWIGVVLERTQTWFLLAVFLISLTTPFAAFGRTVPPMSLAQVRSWLYLTQMPAPGGGPNSCLFQNLPGLGAASITPDLVVVPYLGCLEKTIQPAKDISDYQDGSPTGRLVFGYFALAEIGFGNWVVGTNEDWSSWIEMNAGKLSAKAPSWLGAANTGWIQPGLYSIKYWDPNWQALLLGVVDKIIDQGFDGVFFDSCDAYYVFSGQTRYKDNVDLTRADAISRMATFLASIRSHVDAKLLNRRFPIFCNGGLEMYNTYPHAMDVIDGFLNEGGYRKHLEDAVESEAVQQWVKEETKPALVAGKLVLSTGYRFGDNLSLMPGYFQWAVDGGMLPLATDQLTSTISPDPYVSCSATTCTMRSVVPGAFPTITLARPTALKLGENCIFSWAERIFPQYFSPAGATSSTAGTYYYRYYSDSGNYLASSSIDSHLWAFGPSTGNTLLDIGSTANFLGPAGCLQ